jgi:hypothetical protein
MDHIRYFLRSTALLGTITLLSLAICIGLLYLTGRKTLPPWWVLIVLAYFVGAIGSCPGLIQRLRSSNRK